MVKELVAFLSRCSQTFLNLAKNLLLQIFLILFNLSITLLPLENLSQLVISGLTLFLQKIVPDVNICRIDNFFSKLTHLRIRHRAYMFAELRDEIVVLIVRKDREVTALQSVLGIGVSRMVEWRLGCLWLGSCLHFCGEGPRCHSCDLRNCVTHAGPISHRFTVCKNWLLKASKFQVCQKSFVITEFRVARSQSHLILLHILGRKLVEEHSLVDELQPPYSHIQLNLIILNCCLLDCQDDLLQNVNDRCLGSLSRVCDGLIV